MEKVFKKLQEPFFTNGRSPIEARELTQSDFTVKEVESSKATIMKAFMERNSYGMDMVFQITVEMKPSLIKELEELDYFSSFGKVMKFSELSEQQQREQGKRFESFRISLEKRLETPQGGKIRNIDKVERIVDEMIVDGRNEMGNGKRLEMITSMLDSFNSRVQYVVEENNRKYKEAIMPVLTDREKLDNILELNKTSDDVSVIKEKHDVELGRIDGEIQVYVNKIAELEAEKTKVYINTSNECFGEDMEKLPTDLKEEIEEAYKNRTAFNKSVIRRWI